MKKSTIGIRIVFTEPILGSQSANPEVHAEFIASKAKTVEASAEEVAAVTPEDPAATFDKAVTVFSRTDGRLHLWDYQLRGFFKESLCTMVDAGEYKTLNNYNIGKAVDTLVFVDPRRLYLRNAGGAFIEKADRFTRSLRGRTMQGDRVCLATSEILPAGTQTEASIVVITAAGAKSKFKELDIDAIKKCLDYGALKGLGQWRGGSYGRFTYEVVNESSTES